MDCGGSLGASVKRGTGEPRREQAPEALLDVSRKPRVDRESRPENGRERPFAAGWQQGANLLNIHVNRAERQRAARVSGT